MSAKPKKTDDAPVASTEPKTKGFNVFDSNGNLFRTVAKQDEAESLAAAIGGRIK